MEILFGRRHASTTEEVSDNPVGENIIRDSKLLLLRVGYFIEIRSEYVAPQMVAS